MNNPLSKGVVLADEVGLGKTIEAALVQCQLWAERRRRQLVICPAALRKQWTQELTEKFNLPAEVLGARTWRDLRQAGVFDPLDRDVISVLSYNFATRLATLQAIRSRLQKLLDTQSIDEDWLEHLLDDDDLETDLRDAAENETQPAAESTRGAEPAAIDFALLKAELAELDQYLALAAQVHENQKSHALLSALAQGRDGRAAQGGDLHRVAPHARLSGALP